MENRLDWLTENRKDSRWVKHSDCNLEKPRVKRSDLLTDFQKVTPMAMTMVSLHLGLQMVSLRLGKLKGYAHRMGMPMEIRLALPTDCRMVKPMV